MKDGFTSLALVLDRSGSMVKTGRRLVKHGVAYEARVSQQLQLESVSALLARPPHLVLGGAWCVLVAKCWLRTRTGPINTHHRNLSMIFMQPRRTMPRKFSA